MEQCQSYSSKYMYYLKCKTKTLKVFRLLVVLFFLFCYNLMAFADSKTSLNREELINKIKTMKMATSVSNLTSVDELDTVKFGSYQQFKDEYGIYNKEPVEWILLYRDDYNAYLMSKYVLDSLPYNTEKPIFDRGAYIYDSNIHNLASDWKYSTLRKWMSETMYKELFNDEEKSLIRTTYLDNTYVKDYEHYTIAGNHTEDKIYILNEEELFHFLGKGGINEDESKLKAAKGTDYAIKNRNLFVAINDWYKGCAAYWLRNVQITESDLSVIRENGKYNRKVNIYSKGNGIRPCITISLKDSYDMARIDLSKAVRNTAADYKIIDEKKEAELSKYEIVKLGRWLDDKNNVELEWYVIGNDNGKKLLLSKDVVTKAKYNKKKTDVVSWKDSYARLYLNEDFYNFVFNDAEKQKIQSVNIKTSKNPASSLSSDEYTLDKIFLLSYDEVMAYIGMDNKYLLEGKPFDKTRVSSWSLRTPGDKENRVSVVSSSGKIDLKGNPSNNSQGMRPAMWIKVD